MILRLTLLLSVLASTSVCKFRNSPIHYIKLNSFSSGMDLNSLGKLAKLFLQSKDKVKERDKSYKGRRISNFEDKGKTFYKSKINFIKLGDEKKSTLQKVNPKVFMDEIKDNEIYRPKLNFTSNAKPELLKYRDIEVDKTSIIKKPSKELRRLNKKYSGKVPFHFGYSRKFQDYPVGRKSNSFQRSKSGTSSLTWLNSPKLGNGLPSSILHMKYPVKITKLSSGKNMRSRYFDNFIK